MTLTINSSPFDSRLAISLSNGLKKEVLDAVRKVPCRQWSSEKKIWLIPNDKFSLNFLLKNL